MTCENDGGPAFPGKHRVKKWSGMLGMEVSEMADCGGMTLRDWFAGQALPGIIAQPNLEGHEATIIAKWAYAIADAMLEARK